MNYLYRGNSMKRWIAFVVLLLLIPLAVMAHSGRTDKNGGHTDHSTGEYHYHHGYPAHQHINGVCPYNFDDQTNHKSGSSTKSKTKTYSFATVAPTAPPKKQDNESASTFGTVAVSALAGGSLVGIISHHSKHKKVPLPEEAKTVSKTDVNYAYNGKYRKQ